MMRYSSRVAPPRVLSASSPRRNEHMTSSHNSREARRRRFPTRHASPASKSACDAARRWARPVGREDPPVLDEDQRPHRDEKDGERLLERTLRHAARQCRAHENPDPRKDLGVRIPRPPLLSTSSTRTTSPLLVNPNVLVELGYALKALGEGRILMVMNTFFGKIGDLPFDLPKRRTITYNADPGESGRAEARAALRSRLRDELIQILSGLDRAVPTSLPTAIRDRMASILRERPARVGLWYDQPSQSLRSLLSNERSMSSRTCLSRRDGKQSSQAM